MLIFPELPLTAWDRLPRFAILESNLREKDKHTKKGQQKREKVKSTFIGTPMRHPSSQHDAKSLLKKYKGREQNSSIDLYQDMNHTAIMNMREPVKASDSISFSKT